MQQLLSGHNANPSFHVMPDLSKTIDRFSSEKGSSDAKRWLEQVETAALINNWPDTLLV